MTDTTDAQDAQDLQDAPGGAERGSVSMEELEEYLSSEDGCLDYVVLDLYAAVVVLAAAATEKGLLEPEQYSSRKDAVVLQLKNKMLRRANLYAQESCEDVADADADAGGADDTSQS